MEHICYLNLKQMKLGNFLLYEDKNEITNIQNIQFLQAEQLECLSLIDNKIIKFKAFRKTSSKLSSL